MTIMTVRNRKSYLGEYAAHIPGRHSNMETALATALFLTSVERNADVVTMTSYAPLLAKEGYIRWNPDLIYFNNKEVKPTVDYYVQQLYGQNAGNEYITSKVSLDNNQTSVRKRIGVSVVRDVPSGDLIIKLVNMLPVNVNAELEFFRIESSFSDVLHSHPCDFDGSSIRIILEQSHICMDNIVGILFHGHRCNALICQSEKSKRERSALLQILFSFLNLYALLRSINHLSNS